VDTFTGSGNNDLFIADNTGTDVSSAADTLSGGAGSDTLNVYSDGAAGALPSLTSVETLNVYDQDDSMTTATTSQASLTAVNLIRGDGAMTLTVGAAVANVGVTDVVAASGGVVIAAAATATSLTVNLNGVTAAAASGVTDENVDVNGTLLTSVTVNTSGTASTFDVLDAASATSISINAGAALTTVLETGATAATLALSGTAAVDLGALDSAINTVTSTASGALTANIGANVDTVLTSGSGNDVITSSSTDAIVAADALAVDAGAGTDTLVIAAQVDVDTAADAARYTNFETVRLSDSYVGSLISGITAIELAGASGKSYTALTAAQAAAVKVRGDETSPTFALQTATGTSDVLTLTMGTGLTTSAASDIVTGMTVTGFETLNIIENGGATASAGADRTAIVAAFTGSTLNDINLFGRAVTLSEIATTVAVNIDGSALTGNGATGTATQGLTVAGTAVAGSVITGSAFRDSFTVAAEGSAYDGGAGNDTFTVTEAVLLADGSTDGTFVGGLGTDTMVVDTTAATLTDNHFVKMTGFEKITTSTGNTSITTGAGFNAAFTSGVTVTTGTLSDEKTFTWVGGLYSGDTTITIDGTSLAMNAGGEDITVTTGAGNDTVTFTGDGTTDGNTAGGDGGSIVINTGAGADTISVTYGTLVDQITSQFATITAGAGADLITKVGDNGTTVPATTTFTMAAGNSGTTPDTMDQITGFDLGVTSGTLKADTLNFEGTAAVSAFSATVDFGVIKSHTFATAGIVTFDDADTFATALVISASNLADVVGYLNTNLAANGTVAFAYDSDANGVADGTMVYHQGSSLTTVADDMVFLVGVTGGSLVVQGGTTGADGVIGIL